MKSKTKGVDATKKEKPIKLNRSAKSGKFVSEDFAKANPDTTFKDSIKRQRHDKQA